MQRPQLSSLRMIYRYGAPSVLKESKQWHLLLLTTRGVARGGPGEPEPPPRNLADQLTLLEPGWADFAPHTTASPPDSKSYLHL